MFDIFIAINCNGTVKQFSIPDEYNQELLVYATQKYMHGHYCELFTYSNGFIT